ncbi:hypothetical protein [Granulosicoccus antarcticus]|uniref:N-acetyltransferase domain-containing protein n=1 Tax=Granulosicoccus antarcticus IMCC3135 TaxID=1192854 RepID=A0A2Z2NTC1_9GAMM|nr:hypothetical protein [Granulosicoccus antarcticus]ASJ74802.1 hypothetical protein IMCC3135_23665 [Granulosicoccus antarcticus IMCC3135]
MNRYAVSEVSAETDAPPICELWARNLESGCIEHAKGKLQQGYVANPAAKGALFVIREEVDSDPALAGVIGLHPRRFFQNGHQWLAATLADFSVDSAHRSAGPALMLMRTALNAGRERFPLIIGIPNSHSYAICRRAGMTPLGTLTKYTLISASRQRLAQRINRHLLPVAAPILDLTLKCRLIWKNLGLRPALNCREASFDDAELDRIWAQRPPALLVSDRSASMLRWRYCRNGVKPWRINIMQEPGGVDCGYVVWRLEDGLAVIGDFFSIEPSRLTASLLRAHARSAFAAGAHSVSASFLGSESITSAFYRAGYFLAESPGETVLVAKDMSFGEVTLSDCYLTTYDNDG